MNAERSQSKEYQMTIFDITMSQSDPDSSRHGATGEGGTQPSGAPEEPQTFTAFDPTQALTDQLMEVVARRENLFQACLHVVNNQGKPGADGMPVTQLYDWLNEHQDQLVRSLLDGTYRPQPVLGVQIPKPDGGVRQLGIPSVIDRLVQQAMLQVLEPLLDPTFSAFSFGYRSGRSPHQALEQARQFVLDGRVVVIDLDLENFFDHAS